MKSLLNMYYLSLPHKNIGVTVLQIRGMVFLLLSILGN